MTHPKETINSLIGDNQSPITNHPLTRFIMEQTPLILIAHNDMKKLILNPDASEETLDESLRNHKHFKGFYAFLSRESALYFEIMLRLDKLQHTIFMIDFFPSKSKQNTLHFTQAEYLENIMELYIVNNSALHDRIIEFVNFMYALKIPRDKSDKKQLVIDNLDDVALKNELIKLDVALSGVRKSRNIIAHSGSYYDEELENIFQLEIRYRDRRSKGEEVSFDEAKQIDDLYDAYIENTKRDIYLNDSLMTKIVIGVLDILYAKHKDILNSNKQYVGKYGKLRDSRVSQNTIRESTVLFKSMDVEEMMKILTRAKD